MRLHQTTQSLENEVNGGLRNDGVYFFENAPNYISADDAGNPILDENGNEQIVFYDGFLDRNRLPSQIEANNILKGKRYFMEHRYQLLPIKKDSIVYKIGIGFRSSLENKTYQYIQSRPGLYFYETFENDAKITSKILGIALTKRSNGAASSVALAGFPYHSLDQYLHKLLKEGHKVAICEQVEDASESKGIVKREVVEVVSPGTTTSCLLYTSDAADE